MPQRYHIWIVSLPTKALLCLQLHTVYHSSINVFCRENLNKKNLKWNVKVKLRNKNKCPKNKLREKNLQHGG